MRTTQSGIDLIKMFEGLRLEAYQCPSKIWTIGYGHTRGVKKAMKITEDQANELLKKDLIKFEKNVSKYDNKYNWTQTQFNALVSFAFNIGSIDMLTAFGTRTIEEIGWKMLKYNKSKGVILSGLTRRRELERLLFLK